jgi:hypothetical protein
MLSFFIYLALTCFLAIAICLPRWAPTPLALAHHGHAIPTPLCSPPWEGQRLVFLLLWCTTHAHEPRTGLAKPLVLGNASIYMSHPLQLTWPEFAMPPPCFGHLKPVEVKIQLWRALPRRGTHPALAGWGREALGATDHVHLIEPPHSHDATMSGMTPSILGSSLSKERKQKSLQAHGSTIVALHPVVFRVSYFYEDRRCK